MDVFFVLGGIFPSPNRVDAIFSIVCDTDGQIVARPLPDFHAFLLEVVIARETGHTDNSDQTLNTSLRSVRTLIWIGPACITGLHVVREHLFGIAFE